MQPEDLALPSKFDWWNIKATLEEWAFKLVNSGQFIKPGTVALFAMPDPPEDWVECDAASYENDTYPDLFRAIGTTHGGTATTFQVPPAPSAVPANFVWMIKT